MSEPRVLPFGGQIMLKDVEFDSGYDILEQLEQTKDVNEANAITSATPGGSHKLIIDVDFPVYAIPSSTPGHSHLYVDKELTWKSLISVLRALSEAGIVEPGYAGASIDQGFTTVRAPWTKKGDQQ